MANYTLLDALNDALDTVGETPCQSAPDLYFPEAGDGRSQALARQAKQLCVSCRVRGLCLEYALDANEEHGVWGGASPVERKLMRRTRKGDHGPAEQPEQLAG